MQFPLWILNNLLTKLHHRLHTDHTHSGQHNKNGATTNSSNLFLVVPYSKGLRERFSKTHRSLGIQVHFKGRCTIQKLLVVPKDKRLHCSKKGVMYRDKCTQADCEEEYIEELGRTFGDSLKENLRAPSPSYQHSQVTGHPISVDCFTIIGREAHYITRTIYIWAMYISVNDPCLNRNIGKYQLQHIWVEVLQHTSSFHLKEPHNPRLFNSLNFP